MTRQGRTHGPTRVPGSRLNPDLAERPLTEDAAVGDAVQRDPAGQAQGRKPRLPVHRVGQSQHDVLGDGLHGRRQVLFPAGDLRFRLPGRTIEQRLEP